MVDSGREEPRLAARRVLENVPPIGYDKAESALCGSVVACLEFLKEPVAYEFVMGVSGSAFKLLWALPSGCPSNNSMGILGEEPIRRTFEALGRAYQVVPRSDSPQREEEFRRRIVESIDQGRPVIAWGIVGAPDEGIVAGYDQNGKVLLGHSYFYDRSKGYYKKTDWYRDCWGLLLIGGKKEPPQKRDVLREALQWAVQLARTPDSAGLPSADPGRASGLAAYDAWVKALERDEDFPEGDLKTLTFRCQVHKSVTLSGLCDARRAAAGFLRRMAEVVSPARSHLLAAAAAYEEELGILSKGMAQVAFCTDPEERRLEIADGALRRELASLLREAGESDGQAVEHLERALAVFPAD